MQMQRAVPFALFVRLDWRDDFPLEIRYIG
jgi:hypothetical protein